MDEGKTEGGRGMPRLSHMLLALLMFVVLFNQYQLNVLSAKQIEWVAAQRAANAQGTAQLAAAASGAQTAQAAGSSVAGAGAANAK